MDLLCRFIFTCWYDFTIWTQNINYPDMIILHIWGLWCTKQVSQAGINNYIPQFNVGCNYLSLPEIPTPGIKVLIHYDIMTSPHSLKNLCHELSVDIICVSHNIYHVHCSLWPSNDIWHHRAFSSFVQVMAITWTNADISSNNAQGHISIKHYSSIFSQENTFENVVCKLWAILQWPQCAN